MEGVVSMAKVLGTDVEICVFPESEIAALSGPSKAAIMKPTNTKRISSLISFYSFGSPFLSIRTLTIYACNPSCD
jgi:hypothetical protein